MKFYSVRQAKRNLWKLIKKALNGEEVIITDRKKPIATLAAIRTSNRKLGFLGKNVYMSADFNAPLDDFKFYT